MKKCKRNNANTCNNTKWKLYLDKANTIFHKIDKYIMCNSRGTNMSPMLQSAQITPVLITVCYEGQMSSPSAYTASITLKLAATLHLSHHYCLGVAQYRTILTTVTGHVLLHYY